MKEHIENSLNKLIDYCEKEAYKGFDPYDAQNSFIPVSKFPHSLQFVITQINKRSPLNLRPLLGIKKKHYTKAMGLFLNGYCNLYNVKEDNKYLDKSGFFIDWIENNQSNLTENVSWGFDYDYTSRKKKVKKGLPTVVHHSYIIQALYKYWLITNNNKILDLINKSKYFLLNEIPITKYDKGLCFGYHEGFIGCCYNASLHAAESLAIVDKVNNGHDHFEFIEKAVQYVIKRQKKTGEWYYSHGKNPEAEKKQIDFHQGFILDCLKNINNLTGNKLTSKTNQAIHKGLEFYYSKQFDDQGRAIFRYPKKYPVDIHNQAQGIITFSKFSDYDPKYKNMADSILKWTIKNMQDTKGYFYYQKYPIVTNKIAHIRWAQAWMFYAISEYLVSQK